MGMINYYMGNIEEAYKFHILSLYANHKLFESDLRQMDAGSFC